MLFRTPSVRLATTVALWLGLTAFMAAASPAWAQQWAIGISGGMTKPTGGAFGSEWKQGPTVLLTVAQQSSAKVELGGEFGFSKFKPSDDSVHVPRITAGEIKWEMWRLRFRARRFFAGADAKIAPFALLGAGVYPITISTTDSTGTYKITPTGKGLSFGGGVDYRAGESVHFGVEAQYNYIWTDQAEVGYKAAPILDIMLAIRWLPGGPE